MPDPSPDDDAYLAWARSLQQPQSTPFDLAQVEAPPLIPTPGAPPPPVERASVTPTAGPDLAPNVPGLGIPQSFIDPYIAAQPPGPEIGPGPVTSPDHVADATSDPYAAWASGPVTAPDQAQPGGGALPEGPITSPAESPAGERRDPFGGNVDPADRATAIAAMTPEQQAAAVQSMTPEEFTRFKATRARTLLMKQSELEHTATANSEQRARDNLAMQRAAIAKADIDTRDVIASAAELSKVKADPDRLVKGLGLGGSIAVLLATTLGGAVSQYTGGRNLALEQFSKRVENDIATQHADIANRWKGLETKRGAIAAEYERHGDLYKAQETYRVASYQSAINDMQHELQQYDQAGGTAAFIRDNIDQFHQAQAAAINAFNQQQQKNHLDSMKEERERALAGSTIEKNEAEILKIRAEAAKLGHGSGEGSGTNPAYTVATGWFNPYDKTQPIMGKRAIGGKGEDAKERKKVDDELSTYTHVQDYWAKLADLGARIEYHKSLGENIWDKFKTTDAAEYDATTHGLVVYLTKELGDKLTQGQLDEQGKRIPQRASWFEGRDVGKLIADAQQDADRDFSRDMDLVGIDATPVIRGAQLHRARVQTTPEQDLDAANDAVATDPGNKDAVAARDAAEERVQAATAAAQQRSTDIATARALRQAPGRLPDYDAGAMLEGQSGPHFGEFRRQQLAITTAVKESNRASDHYDILRNQFLKADTADHLKGIKQAGDVAAANRAHELKLGALARDAVQARELAEVASAKAHELLGQQARLNYMQQRTNSIRAGINPDVSPVPSRPLLEGALPNKSYAPGADPREEYMPRSRRSVPPTPPPSIPERPHRGLYHNDDPELPP